MTKQEIRNRIQTINTELSKNGYTINDIESFWKDCLNEVQQTKMNEDLEEVKKIYGDGYTYEHKKGTQPNLMKLNLDQRVCASKIKGYHILMTNLT